MGVHLTKTLSKNILSPPVFVINRNYSKKKKQNYVKLYIKSSIYLVWYAKNDGSVPSYTERNCMGFT